MLSVALDVQEDCVGIISKQDPSQQTKHLGEKVSFVIDRCQQSDYQRGIYSTNKSDLFIKMKEWYVLMLNVGCLTPPAMRAPSPPPPITQMREVMR